MIDNPKIVHQSSTYIYYEDINKWRIWARFFDNKWIWNAITWKTGTMQRKEANSLEKICKLID